MNGPSFFPSRRCSLGLRSVMATSARGGAEGPCLRGAWAEPEDYVHLLVFLVKYLANGRSNGAKEIRNLTSCGPGHFILSQCCALSPDPGHTDPCFSPRQVWIPEMETRPDPHPIHSLSPSLRSCVWPGWPCTSLGGSVPWGGGWGVVRGDSWGTAIVIRQETVPAPLCGGQQAVPHLTAHAKSPALTPRASSLCVAATEAHRQAKPCSWVSPPWPSVCVPVLV